MKTLTLLLSLALLSSAATANRATRYAEPLPARQISDAQQIDDLLVAIDRAIAVSDFYIVWFGDTSPENRRYFQGRRDGLTAARAMLLAIKDDAR